jgi:small ligand-binding sensory domain FIST
MSRLSVGVGLSEESDSISATRIASQKALAQAGIDRADWALCFFTAPHLSHADSVRRIVLETTRCDALVGCSAMGVLASGIEVERAPGVAVMVGAGAQVEAHSAVLPQGGEGFVHLRQLIGAHMGRLREQGQTGNGVLVVLPDTYQVDPAMLQETMSKDAAGVPILGGGATDDGTVGVCLQIGMEGVRSGSIATLGFSGPLQMAVGITQSCCAVGEPRFITQAKNHVLVEIDGRPALHAFIDQGKALGIETMQQAAQELMFGFPLDSEHPEFVGESCLVRSLAGFDQETHGLVVPYPMQPQSAMGFMHRSRQTAEQDLLRMVDRVAEQVGGRPDFGLYFDCAARGRGLYGRSGVDVQAIQDRLGAFPLVGMFGGFELASALGRPQVYTYTGVLALFREIP